MQEVDDASKTHADRVAEDGAALAKSLGLQAEPLAVADEGNVADAIVELAHNRGVAAIVDEKRRFAWKAAIATARALDLSLVPEILASPQHGR